MRLACSVGNGRTGARIDLGGREFSALTIEEVTVSGTGAMHGVVLQNGVAPEGWDEHVVRLGATEENDASRTESLGLAEAAQAETFEPPPIDC